MSGTTLLLLLWDDEDDKPVKPKDAITDAGDHLVITSGSIIDQGAYLTWTTSLPVVDNTTHLTVTTGG